MMCYRDTTFCAVMDAKRQANFYGKRVIVMEIIAIGEPDEKNETIKK